MAVVRFKRTLLQKLGEWVNCGDVVDRRKAHPARGMFVNLYTNTWASNFPLWNDEDASFRFVLK